MILCWSALDTLLGLSAVLAFWSSNICGIPSKAKRDQQKLDFFFCIFFLFAFVNSTRSASSDERGFCCSLTKHMMIRHELFCIFFALMLMGFRSSHTATRDAISRAMRTRSHLISRSHSQRQKQTNN